MPDKITDLVTESSPKIEKIAQFIKSIAITEAKTITKDGAKASKPTDSSFPSKHLPLWFLYRGSDVSKTMTELRNSSSVEDKNVANRINILFANLQNYGPIRREFHNYIYIGGKTDLHHCHVTNSIIVEWQSEESAKVISISYVGTRENYDYNRKRTEIQRKAVITRAVSMRDSEGPWKHFWETKMRKEEDSSKTVKKLKIG